MPRCGAIIFTAVAVFSNFFPVAAAEAALPSWDAALVLHSNSTTARFNARCLDGSPGGFYYRPAMQPDVTRWRLHIQGGGWALTAAAAAARANSTLGSSTFWPPALSSLWVPGGVAFNGLMGTNASNPFGSWHMVWLAYCDGSSLTSDRSEPLQPPGGGPQLYFRGRALLDAHLAELEVRYGFASNSSEVLVSGTSAGGLAVFLQASTIKAAVRPSARVVAVPDSGMFSDVPAYGTSVRMMYDAYKAAIAPAFWNVSLRGGPSRCLAMHGAHCFFAHNVYPYLDDIDGVFVVQSSTDAANMQDFLNLSCSLAAPAPPYPAVCSPAQSAAVQALARGVESQLAAARAPFAARDGYFLNSCFQHGASCRSADWFDIRIGGRSANDTLWSWYAGARGPTTAQDAPWPSDSTCPPQQRTDGGPGPC